MAMIKTAYDFADEASGAHPDVGAMQKIYNVYIQNILRDG